MTDEAADPRRPASGEGPPDAPASSPPPARPAPPPGPAPVDPSPPDPDPAGSAAGAHDHPHESTAGAHGAPGHTAAGSPGSPGYATGAPGTHGHAAGAHGFHGYAGSDPPPGTTPFASLFTARYGLVRPRSGRYLAGVCAAIGRATDTDPILWRVLLAVLGFFGGIGIVVYLAAWLIIPAEGDSASPVESMLGRGRSSMSPILVIVLGILVAVLFGYIVTDASRAVLLGAAILIGGALLLNRNGAGSARQSGAVPPTGPAGPTGFTGPAGPTPAGSGAAPYPGPVAPAPPAGSGHPAPPGAPVAAPLPADPAASAPSVPPGPEPSTVLADPDLTPAYPSWYRPARPAPAAPLLSGPSIGGGPYPPPGPAGGWLAPPAVSGAVPLPGAGYRPPFAPHGPYAPAGPRPPGPLPPVAAPKRPKPPKPPRERSPLGAATFSMIFCAIGVVAILDLVDAVPVRPSTYFAAVLLTIALGLLVGAWFGRARWLIALGLVASAALGISTLAESYGADQHQSPVVWRPADHDALAVRYQTRFGDATLDLRQVDFSGRATEVTVRVSFGKLRVILPPEVDTTVMTEVDAGDARIFGTRWSGVDGAPREVTDLGTDGAGGGSLRLLLHVTAGDAEVNR